MHDKFKENEELERIAKLIIDNSATVADAMTRLTVVAGMVMRTVVPEEKYLEALAHHTSMLSIAPEKAPVSLTDSFTIGSAIKH